MWPYLETVRMLPDACAFVNSRLSSSPEPGHASSGLPGPVYGRIGKRVLVKRLRIGYF